MFETVEDESEWNDEPVSQSRPSKFGGDFRNNRYNNAYGNYSGGYGPPVRPSSGGRPQPPLGFGPSFGFPPQPLFMWGRGFGPGGPPAKKPPHCDRAIKYLARCGVAKENLKHLTREFLQYIEPQHCGICGHSFDSLTTSRMHYVSKNHLKNQKKWLSQKSDVGMRKEESILFKQPLRARELYCELCDVQITSKTHAESHYFGKPHRSVVEGRRRPKNVILLEPSMAGRLEHLIRREKKNLKNLVEEPSAEAAKEPKVFVPELYCEICKTTVSCTEQMTMHLNGKRHLTKEKQHILKVMKGDIPENKDNEKNAPEETATATATANATAAATATATATNADEEENDNEEDDSFDWGNGGGGTWDEPAVEEKKDDDVFCVD